MREFPFPLTEYLTAGLRNTKKNVREFVERGSNRNRPGLIKAYNVQVSERGLEPYRPVIIPFTQSTLNAAGVTLDWPFPQLIKGKKYTFLCVKQGIFLVNTDDYSLYPLDTTFKAENRTASGSIVIGNQWQLMDFWDTWALHNGITTIFHSGRDTMLGNTDKIYTSSSVRVQAGCAFRGRSWMGGFDPDYFYQSDWKTFIQGFADNTTSDIRKILDNLGENFVWWSSIGGGDVFSLFYNATDAQQGFVTSSFTSNSNRPYIFDLMKRNEQGAMPMPWQGKVRHMKPLGDYIMVYGDGGVSALAPQSARVGVIEFQQFKQGISNTGAVGGDESEQIFLDGSGVLWYIDRSLSIQRLDFREFMEGLLGTDVIISYSSREGRFYICNGVKAFTFSKGGGLTEHSQQVTSLIENDGADLGMGEDESAMSDSWEVLTDTIDFRERGHKTVTFVEVAAEVPKDTYGQNPRIKVGCDFRYRNNQSFVSSRDIPVNHFGQARVGITAPDLRIRIKGDNFRDFNIEDLIVKVQMGDSRFTRSQRLPV